MSDETNAESLADDGAQALEAKTDENTEQKDSQVETKTDETTTISLEKYREELSQKNNEAKNLRQRLKSVDTDLSSTKEQLQAAEVERDALRERLHAIELEKAFGAAARDQKIGAKNPERLFKLVDKSSLTLKEDGSIEGVDKVLKQLKDEWPEMFSSGTANGGAGNGQAPNAADMNALIRRTAGIR